MSDQWLYDFAFIYISITWWLFLKFSVNTYNVLSSEVVITSRYTLPWWYVWLTWKYLRFSCVQTYSLAYIWNLVFYYVDFYHRYLFKNAEALELYAQTKRKSRELFRILCMLTLLISYEKKNLFLFPTLVR